MTNVLNIENLTVTFDTADGPFKAVDGVNFKVDQNDILAIVGESGSGKSVSMLAVMGLLPNTATITADKIEFEGKDISNLSDRDRRHIIGKDISMIFQEPIASLNPCFTVGFQIHEMLKTHTNKNKKERAARALELFNLVGIPDPEKKLKSYPHQLSGGQCQRVMIAMAISCDPKLLIADEPTTALDVTIQKQILDLLLDIQAKTNMALIMITHDMGVVAETAHRVVVQYKGQQMEEANVLDLFENPQNAYTKALLSALPERAEGDRLPTVSDFAESFEKGETRA
jgi:dipeptide transport system ATP-binding protein